MTTGGLATASVAEASVAPPVVGLRVLLIGDGASDATTAAWASALTTEGVPYTEVDAAGTSPAWTLTLPTLTSGSTGLYDGVVVADSPLDFTSGQLTALYAYESTFRVNQVDGYMYPDPALGATVASSGALDGTTGTLTSAGLAIMPGLAGPVPFATGTYGYGATATGGAAYTPLITNSAGNALAGIYQHPGSDPQAGTSELSLYFNYSSSQLQWLLLAPGLINWVTQGTHLGLNRNYVEMDVDDTFTPDDGWDTTTHEDDYTDTDSLRMTPADVVTSAEWSQANNFRLDQLFNYGSTVAAQAGGLAFAGSTVDSGVAGPDPLLAQFQAADPKTGKPYADDFGWISHTYDTPYLDVGCASQNYIEAELNENTSSIAAAPGATAGTYGLGITSSTDDTLAYGAEDPQVFVPGNHSGFADLVPGTPSTVDPPDLDPTTVSASGGTLAPGTYEYAVTDQFTNSSTAGQSEAYVTEPVTVLAGQSVNLQWEAICHAADYLIYRAPVVSGTAGAWSLIDTLSTPFSATLPDNSSGDPTSTSNVANGGELQESYTDTGAAGTPETATWTPPTTEAAQESPWEQNPYFVPALEAVGITTVGDDASKAYPNPPDAPFGIGATYTGPTYAAGQTFLDGTAQVAPRHPINIFYDASTEAQEVDEYNTLYLSSADGGHCDPTTTACLTAPATFPQIVDSIVTQMLQFMLTNNPEPTYVHQTNLMGVPPVCTAAAWPVCSDVATATSYTTPDTTGDGLLYTVLDPLLAAYHSYYSSATPYVQLTLGQIGTVLAYQSAWTAALAAGSVTASEDNGVVTITNNGTSALEVPTTVPNGTTLGTSAFGQAYGGDLSGWQSVSPGTSVTLTEKVALSITSAASATSNVGAPFSFNVYATGAPLPALSEVGTLPGGITFTDNGNGTATIAGTSAAGSGGTYPFTITATSSAGSTSQSFVLTNTGAPTITSPATATFTTTFLGSYAITTTGYPAPTLTDTASTLPSGLTFVDNGNGTGAISGTPATGTQGSYPVVLQATNASGSTATLDLAVTVNPATAPVLSIPAADFTLNQMGSVAVTATGHPTPAITETGTLPAGLTFTDNGSGTAILSGTPTSTGTTTLTVTATNGVSPAATQTLTVIVGQAPAFTSTDSASATAGSPFNFTVTTSGYPAPSIGASGLPAGFTFTDLGNGTATISGTPTAAEIGDSSISLSAVSVAGSTAQTLDLAVAAVAAVSTPTAPVFPVVTPGATSSVAPTTVTTAPPTTQPSTSARHAPVFMSAATATATVGHRFSFMVTAVGEPVPALLHSALPKGLSWKSSGAGRATISGVPLRKAAGTVKVSLKASSATGSATQVLVIRVLSRPGLSAGPVPAGTVGRPYRFTLSAFGYPKPTVTESGALPKGLSFKKGRSGGLKVSGTPAPGSAGVHHIRIVVSNPMGKTTVHYTLIIKEPVA
jgi:hypothetical protein